MTNCPKCNGTNLRVSVPVVINGPPLIEGNISKRIIAWSSVEITAAKWECLETICTDCCWTSGTYGNYVSRCTQVLEEIVADAEDCIKRNPDSNITWLARAKAALANEPLPGE